MQHRMLRPEGDSRQGRVPGAGEVHVNGGCGCQIFTVLSDPECIFAFFHFKPVFPAVPEPAFRYRHREGDAAGFPGQKLDLPEADQLPKRLVVIQGNFAEIQLGYGSAGTCSGIGDGAGDLHGVIGIIDSPVHPEIFIAESGIGKTASEGEAYIAEVV